MKPDSLAGRDTARTTADAVEMRAAEFPEATALSTQRREGWSYERLANFTKSVRADLTAILEPEQPLALVMTAEAASVGALLAAESSHHLAVLIPPGLPADELRSVLLESGAHAIAVPPSAQAIVQPPETPIVGERSGLLWYTLPGVDAPAPHPGPSGDAWICQLTSGSMGPSRLAVRTHSAVAVEIESVADRLSLSSDDSVLCASSTAHSYGLIGGLLAPLSVGAQVILASPPQDAATFALTAHPTVMFGLAVTYQTLLSNEYRHLIGSGGTLDRVRYALSAGAPLPEGLFDAFVSRFRVPIRQDYGTTETGTIAIDGPGPADPDRVGAALPHVEVRVEPPFREVEVRSAAVAVGYLSGGSLHPAVDQDGWYHTGDSGEIDGSGRMSLTGRLRDPILTGQGQVHPEEIERVIRQLPDVRDVAVVAVASGSDVAEAKAVVVAPDLDASRIHEWLRNQLPANQLPATIELRDELPRSPAGKILQKYIV